MQSATTPALSSCGLLVGQGLRAGLAQILCLHHLLLNVALWGLSRPLRRADPVVILKRQLGRGRRSHGHEQEDAAGRQECCGSLNKVGPGSGPVKTRLQEPGQPRAPVLGSGPPLHWWGSCSGVFGTRRLLLSQLIWGFLPSPPPGRKPRVPEGWRHPCLETGRVSPTKRCVCLSHSLCARPLCGQQVQEGLGLRTPLALSPDPFIHEESEFGPELGPWLQARGMVCLVGDGRTDS